MGRKCVDSNELFIEGLPKPKAHVVGEEGKGSPYLLPELNVERILIAASIVGLERCAIGRAVRYAQERIVFGRPIGMNQSI